MSRRHAPTGSSLVPILSSWHQIDGGEDFGASITGGGSWFWANAVPATFEAVLLNIENTSFDAAQALVEGVSSGGSALTGWGLNVASNWNLDTSTTDPGDGTFDSPSHSLSSVMPLSSPLAPGAYFTLHQRRSTGILAAGKTFSSGIWPESGQVAGQAFQEGDQLGSSVSGIGIGPLTTRLLLRRPLGSDKFYVIMPWGDSTVAPIRPIAAVNNTAKEGHWYFANQYLRNAGKRVRFYSGGQGGASWAQILSRVRASIPWMIGKVSEVWVLAWTWNSPWGNVEDAMAAWAEYLVLQAELAAVGILCSPFVLNPYTNRNSAGQIAAFTAIKNEVLAHPRGLAFDEVVGDTAWPSMPEDESEDEIHTNRTGSARVGPIIGAAGLARATETHPELA